MTADENTHRAKDLVGLLEGLSTTRAIRRYVDAPIPDDALRDIMFAATRAPSGSNRQPFRFLVLTDSVIAQQAKALIAVGAQKMWAQKRVSNGYDVGTGGQVDSPKARMAKVMQEYVDNFERVPVLVLACLVRYREPTPSEGASVYPACQNILLAARALGYGGVLTGFQGFAETELRTLLHIPDDTALAGAITLGKPVGHHGPVRRVPMDQLIYGDQWGTSPLWAIDPPGTAVMARRAHGESPTVADK